MVDRLGRGQVEHGKICQSEGIRDLREHAPVGVGHGQLVGNKGVCDVRWLNLQVIGSSCRNGPCECVASGKVDGDRIRRAKAARLGGELSHRIVEEDWVDHGGTCSGCRVGELNKQCENITCCEGAK